MHSDFDEDDFVFDLIRLLSDSVKEILRDEDPRRFLRWFRDHLGSYTLPQYAGQIDEDAINRLATFLGRAVWNATPLPGKQMRPAPLPAPGRNTPCPCGSGRKFKQCCAREIEPPTLDTEVIWGFVLEHLPAETLTRCVARGQIPVEALAVRAADFIEMGKPKKGQQLLEPLFAGEIDKSGPAFGFALQMLCNTYDELGWWKKKDELLQRIVKTVKRSPLRSEAWCRIATIRVDAGDEAAAWEAFRNAQRDAPDSPGVAVVEVQLLLGTERLDEARERARFWVKRLTRMGYEAYEGPLEFLNEVAEDPRRVLAETTLAMANGAGDDLRAWLETVSERALPVYSIRTLDAPDSGEDEADLTGPPETLFLDPSPGIRELETKWSQVFFVPKPFSTNDYAYGDVDPWDPDEEARWMAFLDTHPEAFDSLEILDDLANALAVHSMSDVPIFNESLLEPVLSRAEAIIRRTLRDIDDPKLGWFFSENRSALRSLARRVTLAMGNGELEQATQRAEFLLDLNPNDNHGFRTLVIDAYLMSGQNQAALNLAEHYPDDIQAEIAFGRVLALYRLERIDEAQNALCTAMKYLPKVAHYLIAKKIRMPTIDPGNMTLGGDDQAWLYRDEMREAWLSTPGALDWLKQAAKRCAVTPAEKEN